MKYLGDFATGATIYFYFESFNAAGASVTLTGLAVTDIEVYKNGSTTQRSSDAGYTLLDTDGIDFDGVTGIHGFSIDLSDNTDAGFYVAGADYTVVVSAVTIDSQTVTFIAGRFSIQNRYTGANVVQWNGTNVATPATAGIPDVNVKNIDNDAASASGTVTFPNATLASTTNITAGTVTTVSGNVTGSVGSVASTVDANLVTWIGVAPLALSSQRVQVLVGSIGTNIVNAAALATDAVTEIAAGVWNAVRASYATAGTFGEGTASVQGNVTGSVGSVTGAVASVTGNVGGNVTGSVGSVTAGVTVTTNNDKTGYSLSTTPPTAAEVATAVLTTQMTESYSVDGAAPTLAQAQFLTMQRLYDFAISGTTITVKKIDGSTTAATITLDDATTPTSSARAT